ncbi:MAG: helix-turn-helix transcriptional regulator [Dehalococcoidia bacterium]
MALRKRRENRAAGYLGDLLRGNTESLLLALIGDSPMYGYSIMKEIERRTDGGLRFKEGTLYPALHRLEQDGLIKGEWVSVNGMERRYYSLTEMGLEVLKRRRVQWRQFSTAVNRIISPEAS